MSRYTFIIVLLLVALLAVAVMTVLWRQTVRPPFEPAPLPVPSCECRCGCPKEEP